MNIFLGIRIFLPPDSVHGYDDENEIFPVPESTGKKGPYRTMGKVTGGGFPPAVPTPNRQTGSDPSIMWWFMGIMGQPQKLG